MESDERKVMRWKEIRHTGVGGSGSNSGGSII